MRNLADGSPMPGLTLVAGGESGSDDGYTSAEYRTGADGEVGVPATEVRRLKPADPHWSVARSDRPDAPLEREVWLFAYTELVGRVTFVGPEQGEMAKVRLDTYFAGVDGASPDHDAQDPWTVAWTRHHGVLEQETAGPPSADGSFRISVPRVRGMAVRAMAPGFRPDSAVLEIGGTTESIAVRDLQLRRSIRVVGQVIDVDGRPVANASVVVYCTYRLPFSSLRIGELRKLGQSVTVAGNSAKNTAELNLIAGSSVDADGRFEIEIKGVGEILVVVWPVGRPPIRQSLGYLDADSGPLRLIAPMPTSPGTVMFLRAGRPLIGCQVTLCDVTDSQPGKSSGPQPTAGPVLLDSNGSMPSAWFEKGRRYHINVLKDGASGFLDWNGQESVEVTTLAK